MLTFEQKTAIAEMDEQDLSRMIKELEGLIKRIPQGPFRTAIWHFNRQRHRYAFMLEKWRNRASDDDFKSLKTGEPIKTIEELNDHADVDEEVYQKKQEAFNKRKR